MAYLNDNNFSKIINNVYTDISQIAKIINSSMLDTLFNLFKITGGIIGLMLIDWKLTTFVLAIIPLEVFIKSIISNKRRKHFACFIKMNEKFSIWFSETFKNIEVIKLWNLQEIKKHEFSLLKQEMMKTEIKMDYCDNASNMSSRMLSIIFTYGLNLIGAILIFRNELTLGGLFAFTAYSMYVLQPIALLANISYMLKSGVPAFKRFMEYFENDVEKSEGLDFKNQSCEVNDISFNKIVFGYSEKEPLLKSINFTIKKGEKVAFVGVNGSGKTSIINLLLRFYEPLNGSITLNGIDIQSISLNDYRNLFCVMNQAITLFDDSIRNNVDIFKNISENEICHFLELATATDFIKNLSDGIDTQVGFNGSKLSGGEKQKVSLARTLAKQGRILILDEATSSFDLSAEKQFDNFIAECKQYDIVIAITHREDILKIVDKIYVIHDGQIADYGTFESLMKSNNSFNKILKQGEQNHVCSN